MAMTAAAADIEGVEGGLQPAAGQRHVMHLVDTLEIGGAERVAVNLANVLPRDRYRVSLCTTRRDGPLAATVAGDVGRLRLQRTCRFDPFAVARLVKFVRDHEIRLLHAHGTAVFLARLAASFPPFPKVIWHDHFGRFFIEEQPAWLYRPVTRGIAGVITVNEALAEWARRCLRVPENRVWYVPNFVMPTNHLAAPNQQEAVALPGDPDGRIVCVANVRPVKDHPTLLAAMAIVRQQAPHAHLLLVGQTPDQRYHNAIRREITERGLEGHVTILGPRTDVPAILSACAIGVLSSASEGLPLALIEYGTAGLAAVATAVGQCADVLDQGRAGVLVRPRAPAELADALLSLLGAPSRRTALGARLRRHVEDLYSPQRAVRQICEIYQRILAT